jgi:hypothetical protein
MTEKPGQPGFFAAIFPVYKYCMSYHITAYCLFDITQTGVIHRVKPDEGQDAVLWKKNRNTQCNFDTLLQVISLRSQPEILAYPVREDIRFDTFENFGFLFEQQEDELYPCWKFDFNIQHPSVFDDGVSELGGLYRDCDRVPMILCGTEWDKLPAFLDASPELRNIYFDQHNGQTYSD